MKDRASWFSPVEGLETLRAVRNYLDANPSAIPSLFEKSYRHMSELLIEEIDDCIAKIEKIDAEGDVSHLCVVM